MFFSFKLPVVFFSFKNDEKLIRFSLINVQTNNRRMEQAAIIGEGSHKVQYNGQGKMNFGQGKVSEKSGNFISD